MTKSGRRRDARPTASPDFVDKVLLKEAARRVHEGNATADDKKRVKEAQQHGVNIDALLGTPAGELSGLAREKNGSRPKRGVGNSADTEALIPFEGERRTFKVLPRITSNETKSEEVVDGIPPVSEDSRIAKEAVTLFALPEPTSDSGLAIGEQPEEEQETTTDDRLDVTTDLQPEDTIHTESGLLPEGDLFLDLNHTVEPAEGETIAAPVLEIVPEVASEVGTNPTLDGEYIDLGNEDTFAAYKARWYPGSGEKAVSLLTPLNDVIVPIPQDIKDSLHLTTAFQEVLTGVSSGELFNKRLQEVASEDQIGNVINEAARQWDPRGKELR